jgi:hypothetical protein
MAGTTPLTIGADVSCTDGVGGKVSRVVIHLRAHTVTHLVVSDRQFQGRLVPLNLVDVDAATGKIRLRCTVAQFEKLGPASMTVPLQGNDADPDNSADQVQWRGTGWLADPRRLPTTPFPPARQACAAVSTSMPPTATSGKSRGSSSAPPAIRSPMCSSKRDTCSAAR